MNAKELFRNIAKQRRPARTTTAGGTERLVSVHRALMCLFIWVWWRLLLISALGRIKVQGLPEVQKVPTQSRPDGETLFQMEKLT